jgi:peptide/nickel transport system substrate-binding protein
MKRNFIKVTSLLLILMMVTGGFGVISAQEGDTLNILYWQAVSILNPHLSTGTKDYDAARLVVEPLAQYTPDGEIVPVLVDEVPTLENGGISEDLMSITWTLSEGLVWSDGSPVTSADVVFSWEYCVHPEMGCSNLTQFEGVASVEAVDELTILVTFTAPKPFPYGPFVTNASPILQKAQFENCMGAAAPNCTEQNFAPIGTGPYIVEEFLPNDVVTYTANPNYRVEGQPFFSRVVFKGGGDAESAARAVLETGEADYAWNLQVAADVLTEMESAGLGTIVVSRAGNVERIIMNRTNPDPALDDMRSVWVADGSNDHPFLTEPAVYQAMSMAIDRNVIAEQLYGRAGLPTCNILNGPVAYVSTNNDSCLTQDIDGANALLDEAGIVDTDGDGVREHNGVPLSVLYVTSTNALRQNEQALVKQWWEEIGIAVELRNVDAAVYFGGDPASPDTLGKFYMDVQMFTSGPTPDIEPFLRSWVCSEVTGPDNNWLGNNTSRYCNAEYDALAEELAVTADPARRIELAIAMNDNIVQNGVVIPLIFRGSQSAHSNTLEGVWINGGWDSEMWNVAEWTRAE